MRILYSHRIQSRDGQSVHVEGLVAALRALGNEVLVVGPSLYDKLEFGGESGLVATIRSRLPRWIGELAELGYNLPAWWRLRQALRRFQPHIIYERNNLYFLAGTLVSRRTGVPLLLEVNAPLADERSRHGGLSMRWLAHRLEAFVWRSANRVFAVTGVLKGIIASAGVPAERIEVVPNGIDTVRFAALPLRPEAPDPLVLGFVGFVRDWHGLDSVIAAMAADWSIRLDLVIVGEGPAVRSLRQRAVELKVADRVHFVGLVAHEAIPEMVAGFDIALQPRVVAYASPLKLFEYMAAGKAIVAPNQPNIREVLTDEKTALLFEPNDPDGMWRAVRRLAADRELRSRLGVSAQTEIERRDYTWLGNARKVMASRP
jgi:glycosyltransferase involved in cell wall biosynthesis